MSGEGNGERRYRERLLWLRGEVQRIEAERAALQLQIKEMLALEQLRWLQAEEIHQLRTVRWESERLRAELQGLHEAFRIMRERHRRQQ